MVCLPTPFFNERRLWLLTRLKQVGQACLFVGCLLLTACQSSFYSYKTNDGRIPKIQLTWVNEKDEDRQIATGDTEIKIRVRSTAPIQIPYSIIPEAYDLVNVYGFPASGSTYKLPPHHSTKKGLIDTTYSFHTRDKVAFWEQTQLTFQVTVRAGKYGERTSAKYRLGKPLHWLVRSGCFRYINADDQKIALTSQRKLKINEEEKLISEAQQDSLVRQIRVLLKAYKNHLAGPQPGAGVILFTHSSESIRYVISKNSVEKVMFEKFLTENFH